MYICNYIQTNDNNIERSLNRYHFFILKFILIHKFKKYSSYIYKLFIINVIKYNI